MKYQPVSKYQQSRWTGAGKPAFMGRHTYNDTPIILAIAALILLATGVFVSIW